MTLENKIHIGIPIECVDTSPVFTIDELISNQGKVFTSPTFRIDPVESERFSKSTYLDQAYGDENQESPYSNGLVEGFYLVSLMDALKKCVYRDDSQYYGLNYGSNRLRFIEPITASDTLIFQCSVSSVTPKGNGYLVETHCQLAVIGSTRPAVDYCLIYLLLPRSNGPKES